MTRQVEHSLLTKAKTNKKDEFYTQLIDIESELKHYTHHFKDKVVYCNCDDPRISNFFNYFSSNFEKLGLKKIITACYKKNGTGFVCPSYTESMTNVINKSAEEAFEKPVLYYGEGGSIPFLNDIKNTFPEAQFIVTGVLGPESNAHGPDEMLELTYLKKLVVAMAKILRDSPSSL